MKDTDTDWAMLGEGEPFFGVLSAPRFLRANITPETLEEFWETGRADMHGYRQLIIRCARTSGSGATKKCC